MKDIKLLLAALGTMAGLAEAELGNEVSSDTTAFTDAMALVDKTKKPSLEDWTKGAFGVLDGILDTLPQSDTKDKVVKLFADAKQAILDGEHAKAFSLIGDGIALLKDIKAFKKA